MQVRRTVSSAFWTVGALTWACLAPMARAQVPDGAPAEPSSWAGAELRAAFLAPESAMGGSLLFTAGGAWAPLRGLEVGGLMGAGGSYLRANAGNQGAGRIGMSTLRVWLGTGGRGGHVGFGGRVIGILGPSLFGLEAVDDGAPKGGVAVQLDINAGPNGPIEVTGELDSAVVWEDSVSQVSMGGVLDLFWAQHQASTLRPLVGGLVRWSPNLPVVARLRAGIEARVDHYVLTTVVTLGLTTLEDGYQVGLLVTLLRPFDSVDRRPPS